MMRTYARYKRTRGRRSLLVFVFFLLFLVLILNRIGSGAPAFVRAIAKPLWVLENALADRLEVFVGVIDSRTRLVEDNLRLAAEVDALSAVIKSQSGLIEENYRLAALVENQESSVRKIVRVLSSPPAVPYDELILDAGSRNGLSIGDAVVAEGDVVLGEIRELSARTARAVLYSAPGHEVPVLLGDTRVRQTAVGRGGGRFEMILPREVEVAVGDSVFIDGNPPSFYGSVSSVTTQDTDFLQLVAFSSPVNLFEIRFVAVVPGADDSTSEVSDE